MTTNEIKNRVADSGIVNVDLSDYAPKENILELDLKQFLFDGLVLKEKEFRVALKEFDFNKYDGKVVAVFCGANVIVPMWAYMLITTYLNNANAKIYFGNKNKATQAIIKENIDSINVDDYKEKRVIVTIAGMKTGFLTSCVLQVPGSPAKKQAEDNAAVQYQA